QHWIVKVGEVWDEVAELARKAGEISSFDITARCRLGTESKKKIIIVDKLLNEGRGFCSVSNPASVPSRVVEHFDSFASREPTKNEVIQALMNDKTNLIGVYGMGGVGKTTLMKEIHKQVEEIKLFDKVVLATVSQNLDLKGIQTQIAESLGMKLEEKNISTRAARLSARLKQEERILLILDDIWTRLEQVDVGIILSEAAIVTLARTLRKKDEGFWLDVIPQLKKSMYEGLDLVTASIKLSYDFLKTSRAKLCFLLCCLLPEDYKIAMDELGRCGFFEGMKRLATLDVSHTHISSLLQSLASLTDCFQALCLDGCFQLEDVSLIGNLKTLEILSLQETSISRLPEEVRGLTNLRMLNLTATEGLTCIPPNVISCLSSLEELYMDASFDGWEIEGRGDGCNASLVEVASLTNLTTLHVAIDNIEWLSTDIHPCHWDKLTEFYINSNRIESKYGVYKRQVALKTTSDSYPFADWVKVLVERTCQLNLRGEDSDERNQLSWNVLAVQLFLRALTT
ncbi:hypothetical protein GIB67_041799, partial [Kingdonia uniflora]